jgi:diguanylate cyclase (GGDEF)-like protein
VSWLDICYVENVRDSFGFARRGNMDHERASFRPHPKGTSSQLAAVLDRAELDDPAEKIASFGRWWFDSASGRIALSDMAAELFLSASNPYPRADDLLVRLASADALILNSMLMQKGAPDGQLSCEVRVLDETSGLRWLKVVKLPAACNEQGIQTGIVCDITPARHSAMRETLSFESTQCLIGTNTVADALTKIIRLVCEHLGWEWGAYWAIEHDESGAPTDLHCKYFWHKDSSSLMPFTSESCSLRMAPGQGLIGRVWSSGEPSWVDDVATDATYLRREGAMECGLHSAYAFPVAYAADGLRHSPGVLEFYSAVARQRDALLPSVSAVIGALIAQTVQRIEHNEAVRKLAEIDDLTGLANRKHFYQLLGAGCGGAGQGQSFAVMYIDLDHFKPINDAYGHEVGNLVLQEFSARLESITPAGCRVGRLGGDEFAMLLGPSMSRPQIEAIAQQVLQTARMPFSFRDHPLRVSASIGISLFPEHGSSAPELLRNADAAMYKSKQGGRNAICFFVPEAAPPVAAGKAALLDQLLLKSELHGAAARNELLLEYQPVFDLVNDQLISVEALVRWRRPGGEMALPEDFIPVAEQFGLIGQIGRWVMQQACSDLAYLHRNGFAELNMRVNMAAAEFAGASLPQDLVALAAAHNIQPSHLCLELTETMIMDYPEKVIPVMHDLRERGFAISLDDFGVGYSSLSRLKSLPISSLKIDRSFVHGLPHDRGDSEIVQTILDLGRRMKFQVIAEGVETDSQLVFLRQFGCSLAQGFLLARPLPLAELMQRHAPAMQQSWPGFKMAVSA